MSAFTQPHIVIPSEYVDFLTTARSFRIPDLEFCEPPLQSVAEYAALNERVPKGFPRPDDHFVIADHMIDLPVVAVDCSRASEHYGRVLAYSYDEYWLIAESLQELIASMRDADEAALFGRDVKT